MRERIKKKQPLEDAQEKAYEKLVEARSAYLRKYPNRTYSATIRDNDVYEKQLSNLECDNLENTGKKHRNRREQQWNTLKLILYPRFVMQSKRHIRKR